MTAPGARGDRTPHAAFERVAHHSSTAPGPQRTIARTRCNTRLNLRSIWRPRGGIRCVATCVHRPDGRALARRDAQADAARRANLPAGRGGIAGRDGHGVWRRRCRHHGADRGGRDQGTGPRATVARFGEVYAFSPAFVAVHRDEPTEISFWNLQPDARP